MNPTRATTISLRRIYLALLFILPLTGCDGVEYQDLRDFVKNSGADVRGRMDPPPEPDLKPAIAFKTNMSVQQPFDPARLKAGHR